MPLCPAPFVIACHLIQQVPSTAASCISFYNWIELTVHDPLTHYCCHPLHHSDTEHWQHSLCIDSLCVLSFDISNTPFNENNKLPDCGWVCHTSNTVSWMCYPLIGYVISVFPVWSVYLPDSFVAISVSLSWCLSVCLVMSRVWFLLLSVNPPLAVLPAPLR